MFKGRNKSPGGKYDCLVSFLLLTLASFSIKVNNLYLKSKPIKKPIFSASGAGLT
jgi:hypothetical protein